MTTTETHTIRCDGPALAKGVRMERPWSCSCGVKFHGYDAAVKKAHREHKAGA